MSDSNLQKGNTRKEIKDMKITKINVYQVEFPIARGGYGISGGRFYKALDGTIIMIETDEGVYGMGETIPFGSDYVAGFGLGARAGIAELAPYLIGEDPRCVGRINELMDFKMIGHLYVKSAIDMACWDIFGKSVGLPLCDLMGGRLVDDVILRMGISAGTPEEMNATLKKYRSEGYHHFSAKVGNDPDDDIERVRSILSALDPNETLVIDGNRGWTQHQALRVIRAIRDTNNIYLEQPCSSYEECLTVRRHCDCPMILDECIVDLNMLLRAYKDEAADGINIKLGRVGGLSKTRQMRDLCASVGLGVYIQETWSSSIGAAAIAHIAHSTPKRALLGIWHSVPWNTVETAKGAPQMKNGCVRASGEPGLGVEVNFDVLGEPVAVYS